LFGARADSELRERLIAKGRDRVRRFTWDRTAQATLEVYHSLRAEGAGSPATTLSVT